MRIRGRLPQRDEHVPVSGVLPDGLGLLVRVHYEGEPIGKIVSWEYLSPGVVMASADVELPNVDPEDLVLGLDAIARRDEGGRVVEITQIRSIGIWGKSEIHETQWGEPLA